MAKEHPGPTVSTAKQLYFSSRLCAFPGCSEPHYKLTETGERVLNSRICHINARSEGGPRWDGNQSEAENRSISNLLLLCIAHAYQVDDKAVENNYPASLLREWKTEQEANSADGYRLNDSEAQEAIDSSRIIISGGKLNFGGSGGNALAAGGGGGAGIGRGAYGGDGGDGGNIFNLNEPTKNFSAPDAPETVAFHRELLTHSTQKLEGRFPGAGGGGAGAEGENAIGGAGGDGGDILYGPIVIPKTEDGLPPMLEVEVGEGGHLPGQHGEPSGITIRSSSGELLGHYRSSRAKSGDSKIPSGFDPMSSRVAQDLFRLEALFLCDGVVISDGLVSANNVCIQYFDLHSLPCDLVINFVLIYRLKSTLKRKAIFAAILNEAGEEISCISIWIADTVGRHFFAAKIGATCRKKEVWKLCLYCVDTTGNTYIRFALSELPFEVRSHDA